MTTEIILPKLGFSVNEAILTEWMIPDGGAVTKGQLLYTMESEKSVQEVEAPPVRQSEIEKDQVIGHCFDAGAGVGQKLGVL